MLTFGMIGYGKMGRLRESCIIEQGHRLKSIHEPNTQIDMPPIKRAANHETILADPEIDAVFICTINAFNKPLTIAALQAGKHVFCEKPPAFSAAEMEEVRRAERISGKVLAYGFNHRHHASSVTMKDAVDSGEFGNILWMRGRYGKSVDESYFDTWRADKDLAGGGILLDQGIHMLDLFLHLADDFDEVHALVSSLYWNLPEIEDNVFAIMRNTQTGCCASLHSTMTQWRHLFSFEVFLERGYMVLNGLKTSSGTYGTEQLTIARNRTRAPAATWEDEDIHEYSVDNSWNAEVAQFCNRIEAGHRARDFGDSASALRVMRLIDRIYQNDRHEVADLHRHLMSGTYG